MRTGQWTELLSRMKKERYIVALFKRIAVMMALFGVPSAAVAGGVTDPACLLPFHSVVRDLAIEHHLQPTVQGRVADGETAEPLIGASVYIQGTAIGTSTQSDGTFNLTTDRLVDVLVISYVGYQTLEIQISTIDPSRQHTFRMAPDRKSTRLNSSHVAISYAVFCLKNNTQ